MPLQQALYHISKSTIDVLPPWLLRARPYHVMEIPLANRPPVEVPAENSTDMEMRWVTTRQELASLAFIADPINLARWNPSTHRAAVASRDSGPIGLAWISTQRFEEPQLGLVVELEQGEAWLHSAYVLPTHRRQGIYRRLLEFVIESLCEEGFHRILLGVTSGNTASRRAHECVGAIDVGRIFAARSLGLSICRTTGHVHCHTGRLAGLGRKVQIRLHHAPACC